MEAGKPALLLVLPLLASLVMITHLANGQGPIGCHPFVYTILTEPGRNVKLRRSSSNSTYSDNFVHPFTWYRINGRAGNMLNRCPVPPETCDTERAGWLNDTHPCDPYTIRPKAATVCFGNSCNDSVRIKILHCGSFYVYELPKLTCTPLKRRYCTTGDHNITQGTACLAREKNTTCPKVATTTSPTTAQQTNFASTTAFPVTRFPEQKTEFSEMLHSTFASTTTFPTTRIPEQKTEFSEILHSTFASTTTFPATRLPEQKTEEFSETLEDEFHELKKELYGLNQKSITDNQRRQRVQHITNQLSNLTDLDEMDEGRRKNGLSEKTLISVVDILQRIVKLNTSDASFNFLVTASNILDERNEKSWKNITNDEVIDDLVTTLENFGFQYGESLKNNQNTSIEFQNLPNINLQVKYVKNASSFPPKERQFSFPNASFNLSPDALPQWANSTAMIVVLWYQTLNSFITNNSYGDYGKIITATVRPRSSVKFLQPVRVTWNTTFAIDSAVCVYWKPELSINNWKTDGCKRIKDKLDSNLLVCECNHLTAFAAMDISSNIVSKNERKALELISTTGCSISLFAIILTLLTHAILWRRLQQNFKSNVPSQVLLHLSVAIGMTDILAIIAGPAQNDEKFCTAVSILLYFFVFAVFGWMLCEGVVIYLQLVNVYTGLSLGGRHLKIFYVVGWVSLLVALNDRKNFITQNACWHRGGGGPLFWTFVATLGLILLINIVIFILALRSALSSSKVGTNNTSNTTNTASNTEPTQATVGSTLRKAKVAVKGSAVLLPLLGLTWIFGLLVFNRDAIVFKYLFAIFNSLQGLMIFVFHVLLNKRVHDAINREKKARNTQKIINVMPNKNTCAGTLSTSDDIPGKSCSLPVTHQIFQRKIPIVNH